MPTTNRLQLNEDRDGAPVFDRSSLIMSALALGLFVAARLWRLSASCLWFDEIFSVHAARHDWSGMMAFVAADIIHPPLFYGLLKLWISIGGESLGWLRLFPALIAIATVVPFFLLGRELRMGAGEINLALLLMAVNGYLIKYAQELRMYSLLLFFTFCSLWLFVRFFNAQTNSKKQPLTLCVINLLLIFTHYYGWLVVGAELIFLLVWGRRKLPAFFLTAVILVLCFSPWIYTVAHAAREGHGLKQNIGWMPRPGVSDVWQYLTLLHEPLYYRQSSQESLYTRWAAPLGFLLMGGPVLFFIWRVVKGSRDEQRTHAVTFWWLLIFSFLPLVFAFSLSQVLPRSVWGTRHLIITAPAYLMLTSFALIRLRPAALKWIVFLILGCWFFFAGLLQSMRREEPYIWCAWERLAQAVVQAAPVEGEAIKVYAFEDLVAYHLWFALATTPVIAEGKRFKIAVVKDVPGLAEDPAYFLPRRFDGVAVENLTALNEDRFWIAFRDTSWNEERPPLKILRDKGYSVGEVFEISTGGQTAFLVSVRLLRSNE